MKHRVTFSRCKRDCHVYRLLLESIEHIERLVHARSRSIILHVIVDRNVQRRRYLVSLLLNVHGRAILSEKEHHDLSEARLAAFEELERALLRWTNNRNRRTRSMHSHRTARP